MTKERDRELRLAVLIDADNVPSSAISEMMEEVAKYGRPTFKRIYGDFTNTQLQGWKGVLNEHAITPMQQYRYTTGKNSSDSALIIDAMDMLHTAEVDGFFIVSSDSDFTRLATRLREGGKSVYGMGQKKTPMPFIKACEKFIYIEVLRQPVAPPQHASKVAAPAREPLEKVDQGLIRLLVTTVEDLADETGWVQMGRLGEGLVKNRPDFDPRNVGFHRLTDLIASRPELRIEARGEGGGRNLFVRVREPIAAEAGGHRRRGRR
jgi:hypothetical protein